MLEHLTKGLFLVVSPLKEATRARKIKKTKNSSFFALLFFSLNDILVKRVLRTPADA